MSRRLGFTKETKHQAKERSDNKCETCGLKKNLECHHIIPIFMFKEYQFLSVAMIKSLCNAEVLCKYHHKLKDAETLLWTEDEVRGMALLLFGYIQEKLL